MEQRRSVINLGQPSAETANSHRISSETEPNDRSDPLPSRPRPESSTTRPSNATPSQARPRSPTPQPRDSKIDPAATAAAETDSLVSSIRSTNSQESLNSSVLSDTREEPGERTALLEERGPPPAYTPRNSQRAEDDALLYSAPPQPSAPSQSSYGTIARDAAAAPPEPVQVQNEARAAEAGCARRWRGRKRKQRRRRCSECCCFRRRCSKRALAISVGALVLFLIVAAVVHHHIVTYHYPRQRVLIPLPSCNNPAIKRGSRFSFSDLESFHLKEYIDQLGSRGRVDGKISISDGRRHQVPDILLDIDMESTSLTFLERLRIDNTTDGVSITSTKPAPEGCTVVNAAISIRPGLKVQDLRIDTSHMAVELGQALSLSVSHAEITTLAHEVAGADNRKTFFPLILTIGAVAGRIWGSFPILDLLSIHSEAGPIGFNALPSAFAPQNDKRMLIRSVSSNIEVNRDLDTKFQRSIRQNPNSDWVTEITSISGSIRAHNILQGSLTHLETTTGSIDAGLERFGSWGISTEHPVNVTTVCPFGQTDLSFSPAPTDLDILDWDPSAPDRAPDPGAWLPATLNSVTSDHSTASGNLRIRYPPSWEGTIRGKTLTGSLDVAGNGVEVIEHRGLGSSVRAVKGNENGSSLNFETLSGGGEVLIG